MMMCELYSNEKLVITEIETSAKPLENKASLISYIYLTFYLVPHVSSKGTRCSSFLIMLKICLHFFFLSYFNISFILLFKIYVNILSYLYICVVVAVS